MLCNLAFQIDNQVRGIIRVSEPLLSHKTGYKYSSGCIMQILPPAMHDVTHTCVFSMLLLPNTYIYVLPLYV